jgi:hypothetical protein
MGKRCELYMDHKSLKYIFTQSIIVCLYEVPKKIVSDRGTQFTLKFWEMLHETMDTQLCFSFTYHHQTDGQTERVNQILEDMLRAYAL